ncbi:MAG: hypothetical protein ACFE85_16480 [Candidatus Hodarchaeota archaeon]
MQEKILDLKNQEINFKIPSQTIALDIGQTLSKIVYYDKEEIKLLMVPTYSENKKIIEFLKNEKDRFKEAKFTGGKAYQIYKKYSGEFKTKLINEFDANVKGIEFLYNLTKNKLLGSSIIVNLGTGTSVVLYDQKVEHLGGSAMGGGFFMGLTKILTNITDYEDAINLASKGDRYKIDLKVLDIYAPEDKRVSDLFREFTAASFGKIDNSFSVKSCKEEDLINSIICLIGENIGTIANLYAEIHNLQDIIFCGGFLKNNAILKKILKLICRFNNKRAIFLMNSEFSGAIGALII